MTPPSLSLVEIAQERSCTTRGISLANEIGMDMYAMFVVVEPAKASRHNHRWWAYIVLPTGTKRHIHYTKVERGIHLSTHGRRLQVPPSSTSIALYSAMIDSATLRYWYS